MKILWLYSSLPPYDYAHWYHGDFMQVVDKIPGVEVKFYGWNIEKLYPDNILCPFNDKLTIQDIKQIYDFDVVILWNKSRQDKAPNGISKLNCLKVWIEGDYFRWRKTDFVELIKPDLILHRHKICVSQGMVDFPYIRQLWFPCSVDVNVFKPKEITKISKIGFIGSCGSKYPYRKLARKILKNAGMLIDKKKLYDENYVNFLQECVCYLSCATTESIDNAKAFEILASGGVLLTNECENGFPELFGKNSYITYKPDCSDLISQATILLSDKEKQKEIITSGLSAIYNHHTHEHRAKDLIDVLQNNIKISYDSNVIKDVINTFSFIPKNLKPLFCNDSKQDIIVKTTNVISEENNDVVKDIEPVKNNMDNATCLTSKEILEILVNNNIKVCLLRDSCFDIVINNKLSENLYIAVDDREKAVELLGTVIDFQKWPERTKKYHYNNLELYLPLPSIQYLIGIYGTIAKEALKAKGYRV